MKTKQSLIKAILFDHDGTLVDSEITHFQLWKKLLKSHGIDFAEQGYKDFHSGTPTQRNAEILVEKYALPLSAEALAREKEQLTDEYLNKNTFTLMPHALNTIQYFYGLDLKLAVVTGAGQTGVLSTLRGHQLSKYFDVMTSGNDVEKSKPDPAVYMLALEKLGLNADQCIALEDTENGIHSATAAGLVCCAIKNDYSASHDLFKASKVFNDMNEARLWIDLNYRFE